MNNYKDDPTCILGDLNARFGQPPIISYNITYTENPDKITNQNGRIL